MSINTRYGDTDLQEFKEIILKKLEKAQRDYDIFKSSIMHGDDNDTQDTSPTFKEEAGKLAQRQLKFIQHLQAALVRVENKTYGVCRECGELISKDRLRAVPHATLCINEKK